MPVPTAYPTGGAYRDALSNTSLCFNDPILRDSTPVADQFGMPKPISGNFAAVFTVTDVTNRKWGVKCFTHRVADQQIRYERISASLATSTSSWQVYFEYEARGILCSGQWYPVLKMEWVEAIDLISFIEKHLWRPRALAQVATDFASLARNLSQRGIAHGDLQHGNLLVTGAGGLRLVDYDGMYVPGLEKLGASELGHPNYQSPARTTTTWGPELDRFTAWLIYCSLVALTIEPTLWGWLHREGDEALILSKKDFLDPDQSVGLRALTQSPDQRLQALGRALARLPLLELARIPPFDASLVPAPCEQLLPDLSATSARGSPPALQPVPDVISDWLASLDSRSASVSPAVPGGRSWILDQLPPVQRVALSSSSPPLRGVALADALGIALLVGLVASSIVSAPTFVIGVAFIVLLTFAYTVTPFLRTPEWKKKHSVQAEFRSRQAGTNQARKTVAKAQADRRDVDRREREAIDELLRRDRKARDSEQSDLKKIEADLANRLGRIEKDLRELAKAEDDERAAALRGLQRDHVTSYLRRSTIASARLPGIGPTLRLSLQASGISCAADFTGISYLGSQVVINLRSGRRVHPWGIGAVKAQTLEAWRRSVEATAQATLPRAVPDHQARAIRLKYNESRMALERSTGLAKTEANKNRELTRQRWATEHSRISAEAEQVRKDFARRRAESDLGVIAAERALDAAAWQQGLVKHQLAAHSEVTYLRFCARGLRG
jgi:serine/threonine protein kinase